MKPIAINKSDIYRTCNGTTELNVSKALAALLATNTVEFYNNHLWVDCSDVFVWGMGDEEELDIDKQLPELMDYFIQDTSWGSAIWCCIQRKSRPQAPVEEKIREAGFDFDKIIEKYGLRANAYDGTRLILQQIRMELSNAWWISSGHTEIVPDDKWYNIVWTQFVVNNPEWYTNDIDDRLNAMYNEWYIENGYPVHVC